MKIFRINVMTEEMEEIKDLYWFEENFVHSFAEDSDFLYEFHFDRSDKVKYVWDENGTHKVRVSSTK